MTPLMKCPLGKRHECVKVGGQTRGRRIPCGKNLEDHAELIDLLWWKGVDLLDNTISQTLIDDTSLSKGSQGLVVRSIRVLANKVFEILAGELGDKGIYECMDDLDLILVQRGFGGVAWSHEKCCGEEWLEELDMAQGGVSCPRSVRKSEMRWLPCARIGKAEEG